VWTFILFFQDFSWIAERTNQWDAFGVGSYGLLIALVESVFVTFVVWILSFLTPAGWAPKKRVVIMGSLALLTSIWAILGQLYFLLEIRFPFPLIKGIAGTSHPLWIIYGVVLGAVSLTISGVVYALLRFDRFTKAMQDIFERLALLTSLYLFLDFLGIIIVIIRNR